MWLAEKGNKSTRGFGHINSPLDTTKVTFLKPLLQLQLHWPLMSPSAGLPAARTTAWNLGQPVGWKCCTVAIVLSSWRAIEKARRKRVQVSHPPSPEYWVASPLPPILCHQRLAFPLGHTQEEAVVFRQITSVGIDHLTGLLPHHSPGRKLLGCRLCSRSNSWVRGAAYRWQQRQHGRGMSPAAVFAAGWTGDFFFLVAPPGGTKRERKGPQVPPLKCQMQWRMDG